MTQFVTAGEEAGQVLVPANLSGPFTTEHDATDHTVTPFNLLDSSGFDIVHDATDHTVSPFNLITGVKGRANSGTTSGPQPTVRIIQGSGIGVSLVEGGGEVQFTISSSGSAPGGIDQVAGTAFPGSPTPAITSLTINPGFVPRLGFCVTSWVWPGTSSASAMGVWAGKTTDQANITMSQGNIWGISTGQLATNALNTPLITATPWTCTSWLSTNVTIGGSSIAWTCGMFVVGGA